MISVFVTKRTFEISYSVSIRIDVGRHVATVDCGILPPRQIDWIAVNNCLILSTQSHAQNNGQNEQQNKCAHRCDEPFFPDQKATLLLPLLHR